MGVLIKERKIMFRAIDEWYGFWIYGNKINFENRSIYGYRNLKFEEGRIDNIYYPSDITYTQGTLCQYIGANDINGKYIFEGDIVENDGRKGVVFYDNEETKFDVMSLDNWEKCPWKYVEVVGNIYENLELNTKGNVTWKTIL